VISNDETPKAEKNKKKYLGDFLKWREKG